MMKGDDQSRSGFGLSNAVISAVFRAEDQDVTDVKAKEVTSPRDFLAQVATFPLSDGMQKRLRLKPNAFLAFGLFTVVAMIVLFFTLFAINGQCSENIVLTIDPEGNECTTTPVNQPQRVIFLDTKGKFRPQPGFNINHGIYRITVNESYSKNDEGFLADLTTALRDLREKTSQLDERQDHVTNLERLLFLKGSGDGVTASWNIDAGHVLRAQNEQIQQLFIYQGQENLSISEDPAKCTPDFERFMLSQLTVLPNSAENYATIRLQVIFPNDDSENTRPKVWAVPGGVNLCDLDTENVPEITVGSLPPLFDLLPRTVLNSDEQRLVLGFDVMQVLTASNCNRDYKDADCPHESDARLASPAGFEFGRSRKLGRYGYQYSKVKENNETQRVFVVPEISTHPAYPQCRNCDADVSASSAKLIAEICQRNVAVLLKFYDATDGLENAEYQTSMYFVINTRNIWNGIYTVATTHCNLKELLTTVEEENTIAVPFATSSEVFECKVRVCKTILARLGSAQAAAELFVIVLFIIIGASYLLVMATKNITSMKREYFMNLLAENFVSNDLQAMCRKQWIRFAVAAVATIGAIATFLCFLLIPPPCDTLEAFSFVNTTENNAKCSDVLFTQNRDLVFDKNQAFSGTPSFQSGSAYYSVKLRNYTNSKEGFNNDLRVAKEGLNRAMSSFQPSAFDPVVKHESLLFFRDQSVPGLSLQFHREIVAAGALESPQSVTFKLTDDRNDSCRPVLESVRDFSDVGMLNRQSPLLGVATRDEKTFFNLDKANFSDPRGCDSEETFQDAHEKLLETFTNISGQKGVQRLDLIMDDLFRVNACNRQDLSDNCRDTFAAAREDVISIDPGFALRWSKDVDGRQIVVVPEFTPDCEGICQPGNTPVCEKYNLDLDYYYEDDPESAKLLTLSIGFFSELPLNGFGAATQEQCGIDDVLLEAALDVSTPFIASSRLFHCTYEVCSSWISRVGSSFADTDFTFELLEIIIAAMIITFSVATLEGRKWRDFMLKPLPSKTQSNLRKWLAYTVGAFVILAFIGMFVGFFIKFGECTTTKRLSGFPGENCQRHLLRQDGEYFMDSNGRWNTDPQFNGRQALYKISFSNYHNTDELYGDNLREMLTSARTFYRELEGNNHIRVLQELFFGKVEVQGEIGSIKIAGNINAQVVGRWINTEPADAHAEGLEFPAETFWFTEENVTGLADKIEQQCALKGMFRPRYRSVETETLIKFAQLSREVVQVDDQCRNIGEVTEDYPGKDVLRSFVLEANTTVQQKNDFQIAFDYAQTLGLDYCNTFPEKCEERILPPSDETYGLNQASIPASWEVFPSVYDQKRQRFGFLWTAGDVSASAGPTEFFVEPKFYIPRGCECGEDMPPSCDHAAVVTLAYYRITGDDVEYYTSFGKRLELTGLWNDAAVSVNLHCNLSTLLTPLNDDAIDAVANAMGIPFEAEVSLYNCEEQYCTPGTERFGDAYALSKLFAILLVFVVFIACLLKEFSASRVGEISDVSGTSAPIDSKDSLEKPVEKVTLDL